MESFSWDGPPEMFPLAGEVCAFVALHQSSDEGHHWAGIGGGGEGGMTLGRVALIS